MSGLALAALAGVVQGIVEWLPISSKTMITLIFAAGGYPVSTAYVLGLLANFGSFFAALWYFRREIAAALAALRRPLAQTPDARNLRYLFFATLATGIVGLPVYAFVQNAFSATTGAVAMLAIGVLLLLTSAVNARRERLALAGAGTERGAPGTVGALLIGGCQGLAALPGISRSAATVTPLLLGGHTAREALALSFLLDVPGLLGAGLVPLAAGHQGLHAILRVGAAPVVLMLVLSAAVSFAAIGTVLRLASRLRSSLVTLAIGLITIGAALAFGFH